MKNITGKSASPSGRGLGASLSILALAAAIAALVLACSGPAKDPAPTVLAAPTKLPVNQIVTPAGLQVELPGMRPHVLALSPDGKILVTAGLSHEIVVVDPATGAIRQHVLLPPDPPDEKKPKPTSDNILKPDDKGQLSYTGLVFSPDGKRLYMSNVNGNIKVFDVGADGAISGLVSLPLPKAEALQREEEVPSGLAVSADGARLYAVLNLSNRLAEIDPTSGRALRTFDVGVAPYDVVLAGRKAYVSNWGGRRPKSGDVTGPAGKGTTVKVDPVTSVANEGSVSVIDLDAGKTSAEIVVQLHASALALSPDGRYLVCANADSDTLSVIDTREDAVVETIWAKPSPADLFGASPNALAFDAEGKTLYAANGTQNALAVIRFKPDKRASEFLGAIPTGWFPGAVIYHRGLDKLIVANIKGVETVPGEDKRTGGHGFNSRQFHGSLSLIPVPAESELPKLSAAVWANFHAELIAGTKQPPRTGQPARAIPERIGEPSLIKHVIYVIKENRSYDQVLGDVKEGNGDPSLVMFGENVTPNQHKLVREFTLLDHTFCCSILSADGHEWSTTAFATDYVEKSFTGWPRSYPDGMGASEVDALAYAPTGFIWDDAIRHGKTLRDYGEFTMGDVHWADPKREGDITWRDGWAEYNDRSGRIVIGSAPGVEQLRPYIASKSIGWSMEVPDSWRADYFIKELKEFEAAGNFPDLVLICLPNDHTSGTKEGMPTPAAYAADNDAAFGRIVEAISRSKFWKETVVFGIEDDPQDGWDHVSGYRTTAYVAGPYVKRHAVVSTPYNTVSLVRTIEQILGLPPMNQFDAAATPMYDAFTDTPDFAPFASVPRRVPYETVNPPRKKIANPVQRKMAAMSAKLDFSRPDACPEDVLNRILWHAMKGGDAPYPEWAVTPRGPRDDD